MVAAPWATGVHPRDVDSSDTTLRFNNSVTYLSLPNLAGARFNAVAAAADSQNTTRSSRPLQFVGMVGVKARVLRVIWRGINQWQTRRSESC
ncbi:hypothetical protein E2553_01135 [Paraburkholderia dipogonis]|uniref:Uncharacterized protein n=1 Tax=Paraburkholderia dipogonis TaxID=1211383 RepID=A0A4Y8N1R0_9BURK|nr:hypothetical protein E2553_01135 [Paraburkholderia dipogonis]